MTDNFYVGAYWGPREESALDCAKRLSNCLIRLSAAHPALAVWYPKGASKAASGDAVSTAPEDLVRLLVRGRNRRDVDGSVMEELGFRAALWNREKIAISFSVTCGSYLASGFVMNNFVIQLPVPEADALELYEPDTAQDIIYSLVDAWEPEWATWASFSMRAAQAQGSGPVVGWLTYLGPQMASGVSAGVLTSEVSLTSHSTGVVIKTGETSLEVADERVLEIRERLRGF
jgi:hypothetical protein